MFNINYIKLFFKLIIMIKQLYFKFLPFSIYTGTIIGLCNGYNYNKNNNNNVTKYGYIIGNGLYCGFVSLFYPVVLPILWYKSNNYYKNQIII